MTRRLPRLALGLLAALLVLGGCRLDLHVDVAMQPDGTGTVTVRATADAELLDRVPGVLDGLRFEDAVARGWEVGEPVLDADGAATLTLSHPFHSDVELANLLSSIGPPLTNVQVARTLGTGDTEGHVSNGVLVDLVLPDGFASFSDSELDAAVGGMPFADDLAAAGVTPEQAMSLTLRVELPGEVVSAPTGTEISPGVVEWQAPMDGSTTEVRFTTVQRPAEAGNSWAGPLATVALVALVAWVIVSVAFIAFVVVARRKRQRRREHALRNLR